MAEMMETQFHASVTERPARHWRRVNTVMADQGDGQFEGDGLDFHLVEICRGGRLRGRVHTELESGDRADLLLFPGTLQYVQPRAAFDYDMTGMYRVQQVYIDHSIFRETAACLVKGDPDAIVGKGFHGIFDPRLQAAMDLLLEEARVPSAGGEFHADMLAQQIALLILRRRHGDPVAPTRRRRLSAEELTRVLDHIEADLAETGGLDTLAGLVDMDVFGFTRAFKETTGRAPHQYLIERRIAKVKELLLHGGEGLAEIAYATGFSSQSHMTTSFTKQAGMPPGKWRRSARL